MAGQARVQVRCHCRRLPGCGHGAGAGEGLQDCPRAVTRCGGGESGQADGLWKSQFRPVMLLRSWILGPAFGEWPAIQRSWAALSQRYSEARRRIKTDSDPRSEWGGHVVAASVYVPEPTDFPLPEPLTDLFRALLSIRVG